MRKLLSSSALLVAAVLVSQAPAQEKPRALIAKALKASGGAEKIKAFQAARFKSKGTLTLPSGLSAKISQETSYQLPNKFKDSMQLEINNRNFDVVTVYDGKNGWLSLNGTIKTLDKETQARFIKEMKEAAHMLQVTRLLNLSDKKYKLAPIGKVKVNGRDAFGVKVTSKGFRDINLFFDAKSGLIVKSERRVLDTQSGQEMSEERFVTEYMTVQGMQIPKKVVVKRDGKKFMEVEVIEASLLKKIDADEFVKP